MTVRGFSVIFLLLLCVLALSTGRAQVPNPRHEAAVISGQLGAKLLHPANVFLSGNYAYVISYESSALEIVDISDPGNLAHVSFLPDKSGGANLFRPSWVFVYSSLAYVTSSEQDYVEIINVSNPSKPAHRKTIYPSNTGIHSVFSSGGHIYILSVSGSSLLITDITNPDLPVQKGSLSDGSGGVNLRAASSIFVEGNYAYILVDSKASLTHQIQIVNIGNVSSPVAAGKISYDEQVHSAANVFVVGSTAYVVTSGALEVYNVANPASPVKRSSLANGVNGAFIGQNSSFFVAGNYAYVASVYAIEIADISNPDNVTHSAVINHNTNDNDPAAIKITYPSIVVRNNILYDANWGYNRFDALDVTSPNAVINKDYLSHGEGGPALAQTMDVTVSGNYAYVTSFGGLNLFDISNPKKPQFKSLLRSGSPTPKLDQPLSIAVDGNYAFVASMSLNALEIVDISDPVAPVHKGVITNGTNGAKLNQPYSVTVKGNYAYVASSFSNALEIVNISDPALPTHAGSITDGQNGAVLPAPQHVFVEGNYAYLACANANLLSIIDISNPLSPAYKGSISHGQGGALLRVPSSVFVSGAYAYVTSWTDNALEVIDVSDPAAPRHAGKLQHGEGGASLNSPTRVFVKGNYAFITEGNSLEVADISDPLHPKHFANLKNGTGGAVLFEPSSVFLSGDYAYVATAGLGSGQSGLEIISLATPTIPSGMTVSNIGQTSFDASWNPSFNTTGYILDVSKDNFQTVNRYSSASLSKSIASQVDAGTNYQIRLAAINQNDTSVFSPTGNVLTLPPPPNPVVLIHSSKKGFDISWPLPKSATAFRASISTDPQFQGGFIEDFDNRFLNNLMAFSIFDLVPGTYYVKVKAENSSGGSFSPVIPVILTPPPLVLGVEDTDIGIKLFPNPAKDSFTITFEKFGNNETIEIHIYDMIGRNILSSICRGGGPESVDISSLNSGAYIIKVVGATNAFERMLIKH